MNPEPSFIKRQTEEEFHDFFLKAFERVKKRSSIRKKRIKTNYKLN